MLFSKVDWIAKPVSRYLRPDSVLRTNINQDYCIRDTQAQLYAFRDHVQSSLLSSLCTVLASLASHWWLSKVLNTAQRV